MKKLILGLVFLIFIGLVVVTRRDLRALPDSPLALAGKVRRTLILDREGEPLSSTYGNRWNFFEQKALPEIPELVVQAFLTSEDRRFYRHAGVDWQARIAALAEALRRGRLDRGASTISEQVVRMIHPRPRTFWSRWLETWEAYALERKWNKDSILEFYLNQIPYGGRRRGVSQAARFYFDRDLETLNVAESLALAVLVRAPGPLDPQAHPQALMRRVSWLADAMDLPPTERASLEESRRQGFAARSARDLEIPAPAFTAWLRAQPELSDSRGIIESTLDGDLQKFASASLEQEVAVLRSKNVRHGALLAVDNQSGEILAWVTAGGTAYDTVLVPRQPGSALKPFLYGLALEKGWTAATQIVDEPLVTAVGQGVHAIRNYSREYYGSVSLREALGNSLNTPAIKTVQFVTPEIFLDLLKRAGLSTLNQSARYYGEGLALGSGEVSLYDLVRAYTLFSNGGRVRSLTARRGEPAALGERVMDPLAASLIADILADPRARRLEFGAGSILNFPQPTSVKTGTATDYRDAWALGFNSRFTVGVWMGDLDHKPTDGNTGSRGPAIVLRSVFNFLQKRFPDTRPLTLDSRLVAREICRENGRPAPVGQRSCERREEYFMPTPGAKADVALRGDWGQAKISFPVPHMEMAWDPRLPAHSQQVEFQLDHVKNFRRVQWRVDERPFAVSHQGRVLWPLRRGEHRLSVTVIDDQGQAHALAEVPFKVK